MLSLKDIQDAFTNNILADDQSIVQHVVGTQKASSEVRLAIYANAYRERLIEALANDYEMLEKLIGEDNFRLMCTSYIDRTAKCAVRHRSAASGKRCSSWS